MKASKVLAAAEAAYAAAEERVCQEAGLPPGEFSPDRRRLFLRMVEATRRALHIVYDAEREIEND